MSIFNKGEPLGISMATTMYSQVVLCKEVCGVIVKFIQGLPISTLGYLFLIRPNSPFFSCKMVRVCMCVCVCVCV